MALIAEIRSVVPRLVDIQVTVAITNDVTGYTAIEPMIFAASATGDDIQAQVQARLDDLSAQLDSAPVAASIQMPESRLVPTPVLVATPPISVEGVQI